MNSYRTHSLPEAAYLISHPGIQFLGLEQRNERSYYFCFAPEGKCEKLVLNFVSGKGMVRARDYADAMRRCKDLVFAQERAQVA